MIGRFQGTDSKTNPIFLVVDEFKVLRILIKEFNEINDSLKRIILDGRSKNAHFINGITKSRNICNLLQLGYFATRIGMVENYQ